jgi:hypothetical protein
MLVILKIPVVYVGWVVWWAVKAEPELGTDGGTEGVNWQPWRRPSPAGSPDRRRRGGPDRSRNRERVRSARREARSGVS